jgi:uncharacterized protein
MAALGSACLLAQPINQLTPLPHVSDLANVMPDSVRALEAWCIYVELETGADITVVTVPSLDGVTVQDYATTLLNNRRIASKVSNQGVLILLALQEGHYYIHAGPGLEPVLSARTGEFIREAAPYLSRRQYGLAMQLMTRRVADLIATHQKVTLVDLGALAGYTRAAQPNDLLTGALILMGIVGVLVAAVVLILKRASRRSNLLLLRPQPCLDLNSKIAVAGVGKP